MTELVAVAFGVLIGLSLGALGGGGSILTVPVLVYVVGEPAQAATTESLAIVGVSALAGSVGHARAGQVHWRAGTAFGLAGVVASFAGTALNRRVDPNVLLLAFAALMVVAATAMLHRANGTAHPATGSREPSTPQSGSGLGAIAKVVLSGLAVGLLTGFFGVGGGFVIVPALVMALGYSMPAAVGTSLCVIAMNSTSALLARAGHESFHWAVILPFTGAAILGSLAGRRVSANLSHTALTRAFAGLLFGVAAYVAVRSGRGLAG